MASPLSTRFLAFPMVVIMNYFYLYLFDLCVLLHSFSFPSLLFFLTACCVTCRIQFQNVLRIVDGKFEFYSYLIVKHSKGMVLLIIRYE